MADQNRNPQKKDADSEEDLQRALEKPREDLLGQTEENINLTGSTTYETLGDVMNDENTQHGRRTQAASPREQQNPSRGPLDDIRDDQSKR
jgi:hypothetical protein